MEDVKEDRPKFFDYGTRKWMLMFRPEHKNSAQRPFEAKLTAKLNSILDENGNIQGNIGLFYLIWFKSHQ